MALPCVVAWVFYLLEKSSGNLMGLAGLPPLRGASARLRGAKSLPGFGLWGFLLVSFLLLFILQRLMLGVLPPENLYDGKGPLPLLISGGGVEIHTDSLVVLAVLGVGLFGFRVRFAELPGHFGLLRTAWLLASVPLVYTALTIPPNPLFDNPRLIDRALLFCLFALSVYRPSFSGIVVLYARLIALEEFYPLASTPGWTDRVLNETLGIAVFAYFLGFIVVHRLKSFVEMLPLAPPPPGRNLFPSDADPVRPYVLGIIGVAYLQPGLSKLQVDFFQNELIARVFWAKQAESGWNPIVGMESIEFSNFLVDYNMVFLLGALAIELGGPLLLAVRRLQPFVLLTFTLFHVLIFALSGILFWKWLFVCIGLGGYLWYRDRKVMPGPQWRIDSGQAILVAFALVLALPATEPRPLGWLSPPIVQVYEVYAVDSEGSRIEIQPSHFFRHYMAMHSNRFDYLSQYPSPKVGQKNPLAHQEITSFLNSQQGALTQGGDTASSEYLQFLSGLGDPKFDEAKSHGVERLLRAYVDQDCAFRAASNYFLAPVSLRHFYQLPSVDPPSFRIVRVEMHRRDVALVGAPQDGQPDLLRERLLSIQVCNI